MLSPRRVLSAFSYSKKGFKSAWRTEAAFRDDLILVVLAQVFCVFLQPEPVFWLLFVVCNALLLMAELLNTGLEYLADHISTANHELLGQAKDVGSAAVFCMLAVNCIVLAALIWFSFN